MAVFSQQSPLISNKEDGSKGTWIAAACGMAKYALLVASSLGVGGWALERGREENFTRLRSDTVTGVMIDRNNNSVQVETPNGIITALADDIVACVVPDGTDPYIETIKTERKLNESMAQLISQAIPEELLPATRESTSWVLHTSQDNYDMITQLQPGVSTEDVLKNPAHHLGQPVKFTVPESMRRDSWYGIQLDGKTWFVQTFSASPFGEKIRLLSLNGTIRAGESVNGRVEAVPIGPNNAIEVVIRVDERE